MSHNLRKKERISDISHKIDKNQLIILTLPTLLLAVTFGICGPLQMYLTNMQE